MAGSRENFTDARPQAAILTLRLPGQVDAIGGRNPWERGHLARLNTGGPSAHCGRDARAPRKDRSASMLSWDRGHPPPPPCGGRLARLNTRVGLRRVVHCRPPAGCGRDARDPRGAPAQRGWRRSGRPAAGREPSSRMRRDTAAAPRGLGCRVRKNGNPMQGPTNNSKERRATSWYEYEFQNGRSAGRLIGPGLESTRHVRHPG